MKQKTLVILSILLFTTLACQTLMPQTGRVAPTEPLIVEKPVITIPPITEDQVPRVDVHVAKAALDSGQAILVDVRDPEFYAEGHAAGSMSIPLVNFELNVDKLSFEKDQWIITYCT